MRPSPSEKEHGPHTLRVWTGTVVGVHGDDVFVELGPRMQGVISARELHEPPRQGDTHRFTLRGKEESLWALRLAEAPKLPTWEDIEPGSVITARVLRAVDGGLQLKAGRLHAFLPRSQTGLPRRKKPALLVGKTLTVEVIEVDPERERVVVSRKVILRRERELQSQRRLDRLQPGAVVHGRVSRIEDYGAFVTFGRGHEGLVHVSNLSHERVAHPTDVVRVGDAVEARILYLKQGGKKIGLGIKQLTESPWRIFEREAYEGQLLEARVARVADFGALVEVRPGVEGLVPASETGHGRHRACRRLKPGQRLCVRVVELDADDERLSLSMLHADGSVIAPDEAQRAADFAEYQASRAPQGPFASELGRLLRRALRRDGPEAATR